MSVGQAGRAPGRQVKVYIWFGVWVAGSKAPNYGLNNVKYMHDPLSVMLRLAMMTGDDSSILEQTRFSNK
jgi:hypothetical protein